MSRIILNAADRSSGVYQHLLGRLTRSLTRDSSPHLFGGAFMEFSFFRHPYCLDRA